MSFSPTSTDRLLSMYLALAQYPILSNRIRLRMRQEMFSRGIIQEDAFKKEARQMTIRSQRREGLEDPYGQEPADIWETRYSRIVDHLTDLLFSQHFSFEEFEGLVRQVLSERGIYSKKDLMLNLNPELIPLDMVFAQAQMIVKLSKKERARYEARLLECKVVLIRQLISDQLRYINIAKKWLKISDLVEIRRRKISSGRIGGKAAGMLLAARILYEKSDEELRACLDKPDSYFLGSDLLYTFMSMNNLDVWNDQKYKDEEEMRADYPAIVQAYESGDFPQDIKESMMNLLSEVGDKPLIVRSSSLLEDNFGTSFAGKYISVFLPNQSTPEENLRELIRGVARVYASTLEPNALTYRRSRGLLDYDERMAILIQVVKGDTFGDYYMPHGAGVAFSRNLFRWTPQIRREDGFIRLVWGLGTRAVDRVGNDYPRLIALSHPTLRPNTDPKRIKLYSQRYVDVIDLKKNILATMPVHDVLNSDYRPLRYIAQLDHGGDLLPIRSSLIDGDPEQLVINFDEMIKRTNFADYMRTILDILETGYQMPVDMEFTLEIIEDKQSGRPDVRITVLQCRPQAYMSITGNEPIPKELKAEDMIFSTDFVVPQGVIERVDYVLFVPPEGYFRLNSLLERSELSLAIGRLNAAMTKESFICVGPGRWGSSNTDLGVPIGYGDIYRTKALIELAGKDIGPEPEPSLGTHFFQDLMEGNIYPLAIQLDAPETIYNHDFFYNTPNRISEWLDLKGDIANSLRLIRVSDYRADHAIRIVMNDEEKQAVAYLKSLEEE
ncbi:MAG: PEP/pyruvate-binding domain-containing protein [Anaerolineaceae bacterium]|nr:PEP/pyruvate-binding domain-containing protein [Anaerolineaceae bacterium]